MFLCQKKALLWQIWILKQDQMQRLMLHITSHTVVALKSPKIKGFLNLTVASNVWIRLLEEIDAASDFGFVSEKDDAPSVHGRIFFAEHQ